MSDSPNKLTQFWQELKRRKVTRVITVYAAAAFVILELVSIIIEPLSLPDWTLQFTIVFLCIGFIIGVILSWIYDVHPEEGIVKTGPAQKTSEALAPISSKGWRIATFASILIIVAFVVFYLVGNNKKSFDISKLEKSIAVLPMDYLSEDPNKEYLANAVLDAITGHLSMIEGLRVMPRTSVEQYRENTKSAKEIGEELDVSYLIEGSFLMIEDQVKLTIQVVVAKEEYHVFFKEYDRDYKDIIVVQSEVAKTIAKEIEVVITPEEKQRIEKVPTTNLTALDFYQRGREEYWKYRSDNDNREALERAEDLYQYALDYDPTFALAYVGLGNVYYSKNYGREYLSDSFLDSSLVLANTALVYDDQLAEAYVLRGHYYRSIGQPEKAIEEFEKTISLNPNHWEAYYGKAIVFSNDNIVLALENAHKSAFLNRGPSLPNILRLISTQYGIAGYRQKSMYYMKEALKLDDDSVYYYKQLSDNEWHDGNYNKALDYIIKAFSNDSSNIIVLEDLANLYSYNEQFEESLQYYKKWIERLHFLGLFETSNMHRVAYAYWENGYEEEAKYYFDREVKLCTGAIELGRFYANQLYFNYDLAGVYAFWGEKAKAYENLEIFNQKRRMPYWMVILIKIDPLFMSIRHEPEFQQIVRDVEAKYQAEHERVRKWLEENDML